METITSWTYCKIKKEILTNYSHTFLRLSQKCVYICINNYNYELQKLV